MEARYEKFDVDKIGYNCQKEGLVDINTQKEEFSYAYIHAVVSAAGYAFQRATRAVDMGGLDCSIIGTSAEESLYDTQLDIQVKSTSREALSDEFVRYPLNLKNYNELRKEKTIAPRILVVVLIPSSPEEWLHQSEEQLCLRRCGYWLSLRGEPRTPNRDRVTVYLPRQQLFSVNAVKMIMQRIETGANP